MKAAYFFSIRWKFALICALLVGLFCSLSGWHMIREEKVHLLRNLEDDGHLLLTSLQAPIINAMILSEIGIAPSLLDNFVEEIVKNKDFPTVYAFITDNDGKILTHSRSEEYGKHYRDRLTVAALAGGAYRSAQVREGGQDVLDMALPLRIGGKSWGALRVGLSMAPMQHEYLQFKMRMVSFSLLIFLAGTFSFYIVGHSMARPLLLLAHSMSGVTLGTLESRPFPPRRDEIGVLQDTFQAMVLRLRQSEEERQRTQASLIQFEKMATLGRIVAGVAHEINNPLSALAACHFRMEEEGLPAQLEACGDIIGEGVSRMQGIVNQLLDFSRVCDLEIAPVSSRDFFQEAFKFGKMAMKRNDLRLLARDDFPPGLVHMDKGKLHQALLNLVVNAADASPPDGTVQLTARQEGDLYVLEVSDQGEGIPEDQSWQVFDIFYTTKAMGEGTGIGLAVTKSIVELHGGSVSFRCTPGNTTFSIAIPRGEA